MHAPMEEPAVLSCQDRPLHWDRIAKLWVCEACGASLTYDRWNCGATLECAADRLPRAEAARLFRPTHLRLRR